MNKPELYNLQRRVAVDTSSLQTFAEEVANSVEETEGRGFAGALVSDRRMRELNKMFRGKDTETDVLSFPHEPFEFESKSSPPYEGGVAAASADGVVLSPGEEPPEGGTQNFLGDIVISAETAERQAADNGLDLETEIKQLILHGLLHLCGYDHETDQGQMDARELELRTKLGI